MTKPHDTPDRLTPKERDDYESGDWFEERDAAQCLFYRIEGWDRYWPYEQRPGWLRVKYP